MDKVKQVIVIRNDLKNTDGNKVRSGKLIAQACHASISFLTKFIRNRFDDDIANTYNYDNNFHHKLKKAELEWINGSFFKVCLMVESEKELLEIKEKADSMGLECNLITDQGHTEFGGIPTNTCLAIGPDYSSKIDIVTGHLKLY
jgi:PTH2 family peptidyl-tRNA hydrolase